MSRPKSVEEIATGLGYRPASPPRGRTVPYLTHILSELQRANEKHPGWPSNPLHQVGSMVEEAGETQRAILHIMEYETKCRGNLGGVVTFEDEKKLAALEEELFTEILQTGAMVLRLLENFKPRYSEKLRFQAEEEVGDEAAKA